MTGTALNVADAADSVGSPVWRTLQRPGMSYALALSLVAFVLIGRSFLAPTLGNQALYLFLTPPVLIAGIVGGWGPGLLATFLSLVLHLYGTGDYRNLRIQIHPCLPPSLHGPRRLQYSGSAFHGSANDFAMCGPKPTPARKACWHAKLTCNRSSTLYPTQ